MKFENPLHVPVIVTDERQLAGVYAVLASSTALAAALAAVAGEGASGNRAAPVAAPVKQDIAPSSEAGDNGAASAPAGDGSDATNDASLSEGVELDTDGHPWSAELHAGTKGKNNDGRWKMKVGTKRPDPMPGYPKADDAKAPAAEEKPAAAPAPAEDDEFAQFAAAAAATEDKEPAARTWADSDLSALCGQAATKLGNPDPIREIIAKFVPEGETAHSRNVPADQREAFASEIEAKAGITYAA